MGMEDLMKHVFHLFGFVWWLPGDAKEKAGLTHSLEVSPVTRKVPAGSRRPFHRAAHKVVAETRILKP